MNPLLQGAEPVPFADIRPEHVQPAIEQLLAEAEAALERAVGPEVAADHDALALVLDVPVERMHRAWAHVNHLQMVMDTPALLNPAAARSSAARPAATERANIIRLKTASA